MSAESSDSSGPRNRLAACCDPVLLGNTFLDFIMLNEVFKLKRVSKEISICIDKYLRSPKFFFSLHLHVPRPELVYHYPLRITSYNSVVSSVFDAKQIRIGLDMVKYESLYRSDNSESRSQAESVRRWVRHNYRLFRILRIWKDHTRYLQMLSHIVDAWDEDEKLDTVSDSAKITSEKDGSSSSSSSSTSVMKVPPVLVSHDTGRVCMIDFASKGFPQTTRDVLLSMLPFVEYDRLLGLKVGLHVSDAPFQSIHPSSLQSELLLKYGANLLFARFLGGHFNDFKRFGWENSQLFRILQQCPRMLHLDLFCFIKQRRAVKAGKGLSRAMSSPLPSHLADSYSRPISSAPVASAFASAHESTIKEEKKEEETHSKSDDVKTIFPLPQSLVSLCFGFYFDNVMNRELERKLFEPITEILDDIDEYHQSVSRLLPNLKMIRIIVNKRLFLENLSLFGYFLGIPNVTDIVFDLSNLGLLYESNVKPVFLDESIKSEWNNSYVKRNCEMRLLQGKVTFWVLLEEEQFDHVRGIFLRIERDFPEWLLHMFGGMTVKMSEEEWKRTLSVVRQNTHVCLDSSDDWPRPEKVMFPCSSTASRMFRYFEGY